jgi:hypothetical protein
MKNRASSVGVTPSEQAPQGVGQPAAYATRPAADGRRAQLETSRTSRPLAPAALGPKARLPGLDVIASATGARGTQRS